MPIEPFFIPIAYAIILLRANFGRPCVFWADIYGTLAPPRPRLPPHGGLVVPRLMLARRLWAYGTEVAYFSDSSTCIGFTRFGHPSQSGGAGLGVVMNTAWRCDTKRMCVGRRHAGERWTDVLGQVCGEVVVDETGHGTFSVGPQGVTVWVNKEAEGRQVVDLFVLSVYLSLISAYSPPLS
jgi:alpha-amylase